MEGVLEGGVLEGVWGSGKGRRCKGLHWGEGGFWRGYGVLERVEGVLEKSKTLLAAKREEEDVI